MRAAPAHCSPCSTAPVGRARRNARARAKPTNIYRKFAAPGYHPPREVSSVTARQRAITRRWEEGRHGSHARLESRTRDWRGGRRVRVLLAGGGSGGSATPVLAV